MRIKGKKIEGANEEILVLPRPDGDIVFIARGILDMSEFDKLCPEPKAPLLTKRNGVTIEDVTDKKYKKQVDDYGKKRMAYMIIKSLEATKDLEWEDVDLSDSSTWLNYEQEFKDSGFSQIEINRIITTVFTANSLNEKKLEEAREHFLAGVRPQNGHSSTLEVELSSMLSGEPAND